MARQLSQLEKRIVSALSRGLEAVPRPYLAAAEKAGCREEELLEVLRHFLREGLVRKVAAVVEPAWAGYPAAALVAWRVDDAKTDEAGEILAELPGVTHCYARKPSQDWPYNLYTMVHGQSEDRLRRWAEECSSRMEATDYVVLFTREELKKSPPRYRFADTEETD